MNQRRQELKSNSLAEVIAEWVAEYQSYALTAVAAIVVGLLAVGIYGVVVGQSKAARGETWRSLFSVAFNAVSTEDIEPLQQVIDEHEGSQAAGWAQQMVADIELRRGLRLIYQDKTSALDALETARDKYMSILENSNNDQLLTERARFGLAQALEALSDVDGAKEQYGKIVAIADDKAIGEAAEQRLKRLETASAQDFYQWFAKAEPIRNPHAGLNGPNMNLPDDLGTLPDRPNLDLPEFPSLDPGTGPSPSPGTDGPLFPNLGPDSGPSGDPLPGVDPAPSVDPAPATDTGRGSSAPDLNPAPAPGPGPAPNPADLKPEPGGNGPAPDLEAPDTPAPAPTSPEPATPGSEGE